MAMKTNLLHLRPPLRPFPNPSLFPSLFSTSSNDDPNPSNPNSSSFSSYLKDVKSSLTNTPPQNPPNSTDPPPKITSLSDIHNNLSNFRRPASGPKPISFLEMYKKKGGSDSGEEKVKAPEFSSIRESLRNIQSKKSGDSGKLSLFNESLNAKLESKKAGIGLPENIFGRERKGEGEGGVEDALRGEFFKAYTNKDLGMKLIKLRPEKRKDERNWFSLQELSERLHRLRVMDEKEMEAGPKSHFTEIRASLVKIVKSDMEKKANSNEKRYDMLNNLGPEQDFMLSSPKDNLVENYFHPDNMSSAEKLKIELKKVRDEFKMSESDCGSARVQVAQLTTKIKHLSTALHKKDKHSRKGLQGMVQRRKKLLKYLRRTDWDSYCLVLSKLGLRDNPDYKN